MRRSLSAVPLSLLLLVLLATPAFAHATFDVRQLPAGSTQELTLRVPLERDAVNDLVEVLVPGTFTIDACDATDGWDCQQDATQDGDTVLTLSRQPDGPGDAERFALTITAPAEEGVYSFPTIQTYDDGEEVAWVNDPGTDNPAPRIQVGDETTEVEYAGDATPHTELATEEPVEDETTPAEEEPADEAAAAPEDDTTEGTDGEADEDPESDDSAAPTEAATDDTADDAAEGEATSTPWVPIVVGLVVVAAGTAFTLRRRG